MKRNIFCVFVVAAALLLSSLPGAAQSALLDIPRDSQHATVLQKVGITNITVNYHRPLVKGRQVWGKLVPYDAVWRAGANENTTISFSDPVSIEGKTIDAGTYGLDMVPGQSEWIVIFSKNYTSWGAFTYNQDEDALRVTVKPQAAEFHEALEYNFEDVKEDGATLTMSWEKLAVPIKIGVNTEQLVQASLHKQLRGFAQYTWDGWDDAANYLLAHKLNMDDALNYCDRSIQVEERFDNLLTKSKVLTAMGREDEADKTLTAALAKANAVQMHSYARQLQIDGQAEKAFSIYRENAKKNPNSWIVHVGLGRMYSAQGDYPSAAKEMRIALASAPEPNKPFLENFAKRLDAKEDINK
jgi:tetratricopeptide (TPR) repeat protein